MSIVTVDVGTGLLDIAHGEKVELLLTCTTSRVDRPQNRPCDKAAQEANNHHHLEESYKQIAINRLVVQDVFIFEVLKVFDPAKHAPTLWWSLSLDTQMIKVCSWRIHSAERFAEDDEGRYESTGEDCCRNQGRQHRRESIGRVSGFASLSTLL
jgi:hypothetical protein